MMISITINEIIITDNHGTEKRFPISREGLYDFVRFCEQEQAYWQCAFKKVTNNKKRPCEYISKAPHLFSNIITNAKGLTVEASCILDTLAKTYTIDGAYNAGDEPWLYSKHPCAQKLVETNIEKDMSKSDASKLINNCLKKHP